MALCLWVGAGAAPRPVPCLRWLGTEAIVVMDPKGRYLPGERSDGGGR